VLRAYTLNCTCRLLSDCGEHRDALDFAERAESVARREAPARTRSCVRTTRAYVHACLGDVSGCLRDLDEARTLLTRAGRAGDEPWLDNWHSEAFVAKREGYCRLRLGQSEPAREVFRQSLALWDPTLARQRAEVAVALADALVQAGEIPEACELAGEAHEVAVTMESARIQRKVAALRTVLEPWKSDPAVRRLDERMRAARSAAR
jgi:tetratricopeptide (TPR) repeat protein